MLQHKLWEYMGYGVFFKGVKLYFNFDIKKRPVNLTDLKTL